MFTGIITQLGVIQKISEYDKGKIFSISHQFNDLQLGESIAINGVCLTVTEFDQNNFVVDVSPETLLRTNMAVLNNNSRVNLERSLQLSDRLGGHFVTGHIDQMARISRVEKVGDYYRLLIDAIKTEYWPLLIEKGSIAVNGVSLTINYLRDQEIELMIIPHTWKETNLSDLKINDQINIEYDMLAKAVQAQLKNSKVYENI